MFNPSPRAANNISNQILTTQTHEDKKKARKLQDNNKRRSINITQANGSNRDNSRNGKFSNSNITKLKGIIDSLTNNA